ncbi:TMEM165/GDT1 family protein [Vibrio sp. JC009]|uniref:TMEM165/GDT1 family protein n=1 Tax=Vibrio sp. JC009 TaxID=2912314 RepID=UPI0023AEDC60|nr:TMEM165/GDT1 family protein [Vibrio sp. JC009]WED23935.1 TMEM165/GDT1 family protein [Vibrio sp. JC009]
MNHTLEFFSSSFLAFGMIFLTEIGDKSQLVCMTLASKHKAKPVAIGAITAFSLLNILAVTVGGSLSRFIPETWLTIAAACLFIMFGLHSLLAREDEEDSQANKKITTRSILITTFMLIFLAELGDKTQLAVVTMSTTHLPLLVWLGATFALATTSLMGIFAGRKLLARLNINLLHKISGLFFISFAIVLLSDLY